MKSRTAIIDSKNVGRKAVLFAAAAIAAAVSVQAYAEPAFGAPMGEPVINDGVQFETSAEKQVKLEADLRRGYFDKHMQELDKQKLDRSSSDKYQGH
ncbi:MAG: hypothetical protein ACREXQ_01115 [Polaromonas sp.]